MTQPELTREQIEILRSHLCDVMFNHRAEANSLSDMALRSLDNAAKLEAGKACAVALATQIDLSERRKDFGQFYLEGKTALTQATASGLLASDEVRG